MIMLSAKSAVRLLDAQLLIYTFAFLVVGLIFKQLRIGGIGPVEVFLALLCAILLYSKLASNEGMVARSVLVPFVIFCITTLVTAVAAVENPSSVSYRDVMAYYFSCFVLFTFIVASAGRETLYIRAFCIATASVLAAFVVTAWLPNPLQSLMFYQGSSKLQGLSNNPNQVAFIAICAIIFLIIAEWRGLTSKKTILFLSCSSALAGVMSGSSAYTLAILICVLVSCVFVVVAKFNAGCFSLPVALAPPLLLCLLSFAPIPDLSMPLNPGAAGQDQGREFFDLEADGGQGSARLTLWRNAATLLTQSPIYGFGPGAHVPYTNVDTGTISFNEAHNTVLDILVISGAIGAGAFILLILIILASAIRGRSVLFVIVLMSPLAVYAMFHFLGRQPLFWIVVCIVQISASTFKFENFLLPVKGSKQSAL